MEMIYSDPYLESPYMIVDDYSAMSVEQPSYHQQNVNFDANIWAYVQEKHCTSAFIQITVKPRDCTRIGDGQYCVSWHNGSNRVTLSITEKTNNKPLYSVTSVLQYKENTKRCPTLASLVMHLQEQIRNLQ